mmetsp:Transcript_34165/g.80529  ORF Transcript_34165/g.80529 Transcript_34165/m.80529 type:complete len:200 (-) Transcript_34165:1142-1741(-)
MLGGAHSHALVARELCAGRLPSCPSAAPSASPAPTPRGRKAVAVVGRFIPTGIVTRAARAVAGRAAWKEAETAGGSRGGRLLWFSPRGARAVCEPSEGASLARAEEEAEEALLKRRENTDPFSPFSDAGAGALSVFAAGRADCAPSGGALPLASRSRLSEGTRCAPPACSPLPACLPGWLPWVCEEGAFSGAGRRAIAA